MTITMRFDMNKEEDRLNYEDAKDGGKYRGVVQDMLNYFRQVRKYGSIEINLFEKDPGVDIETSQKIIERVESGLFALLEEYQLNL